jgi:restriction system protein
VRGKARTIKATIPGTEFSTEPASPKQAMSRRSRKRDERWFEIFFGLFTKYPAWLSVPVAFLAFESINGLIVASAQLSPFFFQAFSVYAPLFGGLAALTILTAGLKAARVKHTCKEIYEKQTGIQSIRKLSYSEFQQLISEAYRRQGFEVIELGDSGADGGFDLILRSDFESVPVQCRKWKVQKVGVKPIRQLNSVMMKEGAERAIFLTSGVFTESGKEWARKNSIELIDGEDLSRMLMPTQERTFHLELPGVLATEEGPFCPECKQPMTLRTTMHGIDSGVQLWECSGAPACRGVRKMELAPS